MDINVYVMTKKDKELLLKDLCARLPYNVKCKVYLDTKGYCLRDEDKYCDDTLESVNCEKQTCTFNKSIGYNFGYFAIEEVKPYLRPMSSMTEEERNEVEEISHGWFYINEDGEIFPTGRLTDSGEFEDAILPTFEYFLKNHIDYRGLIPRGLALEAKDGMYNIK